MCDEGYESSAVMTESDHRPRGTSEVRSGSCGRLGTRWSSSVDVYACSRPGSVTVDRMEEAWNVWSLRDNVPASEWIEGFWRRMRAMHDTGQGGWEVRGLSSKRVLRAVESVRKSRE